MAEITIAGLVDAEDLSDDDMLAVSQPDAYNPVTLQLGDTRKVTLPLLAGYMEETLVTKKPLAAAQILQSHLAFAKGKELLGTKASGAQANLAALKIYNEGQPEQVEQVEIGSKTEHLNLNTDENGEYGDHISVDTKAPDTHAAKKEIIAYMSDVHGLAEMVDGYGRNLMTLLGKISIVDTIAEIKRLCNNSAQIDASGVPRFDA
ncbi:MAG: hypothetical protein LBB83_05180, partial [Treponema sp.]|nr:hypothetical protein [Treponema sp.]